jgi:hypothetical protein
MILYKSMLLVLLHQQLCDILINGNPISIQDESNHDCLPCHIVRPDISIEEIDSVPPQLPIQCITSHSLRTYREGFDISLPEALLQSQRHVIDGGNAFICIPGAYIDESSRSITVPNDYDFKHPMSAYKETQHQNRYLQGQESTETTQELRLLVLRVIDATGNEPIESIDSIEGAIFGTGVNPENISSSASVVEHLAAITHNKVKLIPSNVTQSGVIDMTISLSVNNTSFFRALVPDLLNTTKSTFGPLKDLSDVFIFCLPDGSSLSGETGWTGVSVNNEPVRLDFFLLYRSCEVIYSISHG